MKHNSKINLLIMVVVLLSGCAASGPAPRGSNIDELPMYGGMDRKSDPSLREADETLIAGVTKEFGSPAKASQAFVDQGIRYYQVDNYSMAMKRFNQAWLLDDKNPQSYWGMGQVLYKRHEDDQGLKMLEKAYDLAPENARLLVDLGYGYAAKGRAYFLNNDAPSAELLHKAEQLFAKARTMEPDYGPLYMAWASARYWQRDFAGAWDMVRQARKLGAENALDPAFLSDLKTRMPDPDVK